MNPCWKRDVCNDLGRMNGNSWAIVWPFCNFVPEKAEMLVGWKVLYVSEREAVIKEMGGEMITVSMDSAKGYSFVLDYLKMLSKNYNGHIRSADMLLQKMLGSQYHFVRSSERMYNTRLALLSLSCGFGGCGDGLDCDEMGELKFRYSHCPLRSVCPVNGYSIKTRNGFSCCNPVYETSLTSKQIRMADLLISTSYAYKDIAELLGIAEGRARNMACEIFAVMGVCDRQELTLLLKNKRLQ